MDPSVQKLLRRTRRKLFFSRWFTSTLQFYFYAFFIGTAVVLVDRIAGELDLWSPYTLEHRILLYVVVTIVGGLLIGVVSAWRDRRSLKELAWLIDRTCDSDALLITALESDRVEVDDEWKATIERKAGELSRPLLNRTLIRLPSQGIRWLFLFALLIDLFLVVMLTPVYERNRPSEPTRVKKSRSASAGSNATSGAPNTNGRRGSKNRPTGSGSGKSKGAKKKKKTSTDRNESKPRKNQKRKNTPPEKASSSNDDPRSNKLYGPKRRHEHRRQKKSVRREARGGPLRDGYVRVLDTERKTAASRADSARSGPSSGRANRSGDDSKNGTRRKVREIYRRYRRRAEKMIRNRSLPPEKRELVRRYFEAIRPD